MKSKVLADNMKILNQAFFLSQEWNDIEDKRKIGFLTSVPKEVTTTETGK